jgi:hypothetical protein
MTRRLATALSSAGLIALTISTPASTAVAQGRTASASGHGTLVVATDEPGETARRQFSFSAHRRSDGSVNGSATLINPAFSGNSSSPAPYQLHVDIQCLRIVGNIAIFGGTTKRTNDPNLVDAVYFSVQDNGEPGRGVDRISRVFFFDDDPATTGNPQLCQLTGPTDFPLENIVAGNVQVRNQ